MIMKRTISIFLILMLLIVCFNSITANATQDFIDGAITVQGGKVTLTGPNTNDPYSLTGPSRINSFKKAISHVITKYKAIMVFIGGLATVTLVGLFALQMTKLGASATDPKQRSEAIKGLLVSGISAALMGSVTLFVGLFYGMFR